MSVQRVAPSVLKPLKDALAKIYWFKSDLKDFLVSALPGHGVTTSIDISRPKREFSSDVVTALFEDQRRYFEDLVSLILAVHDINDPSWLKGLEDGELKYAEAVNALTTLESVVGPYRAIRSEADQIRARTARERKQAELHRAMSEALDELRLEFERLRQLDPQPRGYELEKILPRLFMLFDIDARGSFRVTGEQIDGAFSFDGTDYIVEAKWQTAPVTLADVRAFVGKVNQRLDNTLGLFLSMNGFQENAITILNGQGRSQVILMDGGDLMAVLQDRVTLPVVLTRKRQHAAHTGNVYLSAWGMD